MQSPVSREPVRPEPSLEGSTISVISVFTVLLRYRVLIVSLGLLVGLIVGYKSVSAPHYYTTEAQFMPQGSRGQSQISGLAQQFGIMLGGGDAGQSPAFYLDLLESRTLLTAVGNRNYSMRTDSGTVTGNLIKVYHIEGKTPAIQKAKMVQSLKGALEETSAPRTGVITLKVHAVTPEMSLQIARNVLDEVNLFNLNRRQAQAGAERSFVEKRLGEAQLELRQAEETLQSFLTENREFRSSPTLQLEFDRLNRTVAMRQQLYNSLAQSYEQAKIEEVRDLPVITIVEPPELPISQDPHGGIRRTIVGIIVGMAVGILLAFAHHLVVVHRDAESEEFTEFAALKREAIGDLTHPWRIFTRHRAAPPSNPA